MIFGTFRDISFILLLSATIIFSYFLISSWYFKVEMKKKHYFSMDRSNNKNIHFFWPFSYFKLKKIYYLNTDKTYYVLNELKNEDDIYIYRQDMFCITLIETRKFGSINIMEQQIKQSIDDDNSYISEDEKQIEFKEWDGAIDKVSRRKKIIEDIKQ